MLGNPIQDYEKQKILVTKWVVIIPQQSILVPLNSGQYSLNTFWRANHIGTSNLY